jgi:PDZ domain
MSMPKHLWTGDWELESAARRDELAAGYMPAPAEEPAEPEPAVAPRRPRGSAMAGALARMRLLSRRVFSRPGRRVVLVALSLAVLGAGAAYAVTSGGGGTAGERPAAASGSQPWLGVHVAGAPYGGALVVSVTPGSPAAAAGIEPGDVITQIDTQPIPTGSTFESAIAGMQPGDRVEIQLQRGPSAYTTVVTLAGRSASSP